MSSIATILRKVYNFFMNIEERMIDEFDGYDEEQNLEDKLDFEYRFVEFVVFVEFVELRVNLLKKSNACYNYIVFS